MTSFEVFRQPFTATAVDALTGAGERYANWPVVYVLNDDRSVYVGETLNAVKRMRQHRDPRSRNRAMKQLRIVLHDRFNKSACLDLESQLIRYFGGDGLLQVRNRNDGVTDADYYDRDAYQQTFAEIFEHLRAEGLFAQSRHEIRNSDLFKLSPFKALVPEQRAAVEGILDGLFDDLEAGRTSMSVVEGAAGTGKTVVAIYLLKLLRDIAEADATDAYETDSVFADYFLPGYRQLAVDLRVGLVIPQQSLRASVQKVFRRTPGLDKRMVLSPFELGRREERFDLLVVDEAHRLTRRGAQAAGPLNARYREINEALFGADDPRYTQLDWIRELSDHQIFLVDSGQSVRPADVSPETQRSLVAEAQRGHRHHRLMTQLRVKAGTDYVGYVRAVLEGSTPAPIDVGEYDLRFFDSAAAMRAEVAQRNTEQGLGRMLSGYGYEWRSRKDPAAFDVDTGDLQMRWNSATTDWVNSPGSPDEVGSIHTIQGYDLNYAGVIIGPELFWDQAEQRIRVDRARYFDRNGKVDLPKLGLKTTDDDLLALIVNIYVVLMTRGMLGTYVWVHDPALREHLRPLLGGARSARA